MSTRTMGGRYANYCLVVNKLCLSTHNRQLIGEKTEKNRKIVSVGLLLWFFSLI